MTGEVDRRRRVAGIEPEMAELGGVILRASQIGNPAGKLHLVAAGGEGLGLEHHRMARLTQPQAKIKHHTACLATAER